MMNFIKAILMLCLVTLFGSCSEDSKEIISDVYITLLNKGTSEIIEGEETEVTYQVVVSKSFTTDVTLVFELQNLAQYPNLATYNGAVVIKKGQTLGELIIKGVAKSDNDNILEQDKIFNILLKSYTGFPSKPILDKQNYSITIKKELEFGTLTPEQIVLVEGYKARGIDLTKWIGKIPVNVKVTTGAGGSSVFEKSEIKEYSGLVYVTLSEKATPERPLLKMVKNAFGLNEYLQWVFRNETIEFDEDWNHSEKPAPMAIKKALGEDRVNKWKSKGYDFNVVVDEIEIKSDKTIGFVYENGTYENGSDFIDFKDYQGNELKKTLSAIDFQYEFKLWDELVELTKTNQELKENIIQGGSIYPAYYIGYSTILSDGWENSNWVTPTGTYSDTEMKFKFNSDHTSSGDYDIIEVSLIAK